MEALCCFQFFFLCIGQPFLVLEGTLCSLQGFLKLSLPCWVMVMMMVMMVIVMRMVMVMMFSPGLS